MNTEYGDLIFGECSTDELYKLFMFIRLLCRNDIVSYIKKIKSFYYLSIPIVSIQNELFYISGLITALHFYSVDITIYNTDDITYITYNTTIKKFISNLPMNNCVLDTFIMEKNKYYLLPTEHRLQKIEQQIRLLKKNLFII